MDERKFDPYTGNPIDEPTYEEAVWRPLQEENQDGQKMQEEEEGKEKQQEQQNIYFPDSVYAKENQKEGQDKERQNTRETVYREEKKEKINGLSIACLILGILCVLSSVTCCLTLFSIPLGIASIICGCLAGRPSSGKDKSRLIGFITSGIGIVISIILIIIIVIAISSNVIFQRSFDIESDPTFEKYFENGQEIEQDFYGNWTF